MKISTIKLGLLAPLALAILALAACGSAPQLMMTGGSTAAMWYTRPGEPPPADPDKQMAQHESWCYGTMGYPECYAHPQPNCGNRLVNVDPPNLYPMTPRAYDEAVIESH